MCLTVKVCVLLLQTIRWRRVEEKNLLLKLFVSAFWALSCYMFTQIKFMSSPRFCCKQTSWNKWNALSREIKYTKAQSICLCTPGKPESITYFYQYPQTTGKTVFVYAVGAHLFQHIQHIRVCCCNWSCPIKTVLTAGLREGIDQSPPGSMFNTLLIGKQWHCERLWLH